MDWLYTLSGFAVGAIVGLTGVGGGSLMTPLLVLLFGIHPATAVGTDLLYAALTKSGGTVVHGRKGHVDWKIVGLLASGSIPATAITIFILSQLPKQDAATTHAISFALGIALLLTAGAIIFRKQILSYAQAHETSFLHRHQAPVTVAVGAILGVLVSISSVGAGALGVAAQQRLVGVLTVDVDQSFGDLAELRLGDRRAVQIGARAAVGIEHAAQQQTVLAIDIVFSQPCRGRRRLVEIKLRANLGALAAGAYQAGVGALAEGKRQRVDKNRFAGAGFSGERAETALELEFKAIDQYKVANCQPA